MTLGDEGVILKEKGKRICKIPAVKVKAVDTTAAGDTFTAGLAFMLAEGKSRIEFLCGMCYC